MNIVNISIKKLRPHRKTGKDINCAVCDKTFYIKKYQLGYAKCCSCSCAMKYRHCIKPLTSEQLYKLHQGRKIATLKRRIIKICPCSKIFSVVKSQLKNRHCSPFCGYKYRITPPESRFILAESARKRKGRKLTELQRKQLSERNKGSKSHFWRGGSDLESKKQRVSLEYRLWRELVFERDNWTCQKCGIRSAKGIRVILEADHIKPWCDFPELRWDINNGRTLCKECHRNTPTFGGKIFKWRKENKLK